MMDGKRRLDQDIAERLEWDKRYCTGHVPLTLSHAITEITALRSRAHAAESQLAAMGEALRNAACTCPLPYRAIKPEEHEESCLSLKVLSRLPERAKAWMGLREAAEWQCETHMKGRKLIGCQTPCDCKLCVSVAALRALETGNG